MTKGERFLILISIAVTVISIAVTIASMLVH
jgi:hypothetical protein